MKKLGTMDVILALVGVAVVLFTVVMIVLYVTTGGIPDTLCTCFYSLCGGECGIMGVIKTFKVRNQSREWQEEDRKNGVKNVNHGGYDCCTENETIEGYQEVNYETDYYQETQLP